MIVVGREGVYPMGEEVGVAEEGVVQMDTHGVTRKVLEVDSQLEGPLEEYTSYHGTVRVGYHRGMMGTRGEGVGTEEVGVYICCYDYQVVCLLQL